MAYYDTIYVVQGDTLPEVRITLRDSNTAADGQTLDPDDDTTWAPIDLSDATVRIKMRALGEETISSTILAARQVPYTEGKVFFQFTDGALDVDEGVYEAEIEITYTSGSVQTVYDLLRFNVRAQF
jgi:hypothetical protein